jgi:hypothetical protein
MPLSRRRFLRLGTAGAGALATRPWTWMQSAFAREADAWSERPPMPTPRHGLAGTALDGRVFAIGGNTAAAIGAATTRTVGGLTPSAN